MKTLNPIIFFAMLFTIPVQAMAQSACREVYRSKEPVDLYGVLEPFKGKDFKELKPQIEKMALELVQANAEAIARRHSLELESSAKWKVSDVEMIVELDRYPVIQIGVA